MAHLKKLPSNVEIISFALSLAKFNPFNFEIKT